MSSFGRLSGEEKRRKDQTLGLHMLKEWQRKRRQQRKQNSWRARREIKRVLGAVGEYLLNELGI